MSDMGETDRDPGDAVPPGVAVQNPVPLTRHDREVKHKLEQMGHGPGDPPATEPGEPQGHAETRGPENEAAVAPRGEEAG